MHVNDHVHVGGFVKRSKGAMEFQLRDRLNERQIEELHALYQLEWWTKGRNLSDIQRMLERCDVIVAFCEPESGKLAAFARVLTDYVYKALIFDVIVAGAHRKAGLGNALMNTIVHHPALKSVRHFELYCLPDMAPFYQKWGFSGELGELRFMRRTGGQA